jgi:bacterioferritin (cytochrome b1)
MALGTGNPSQSAMAMDLVGGEMDQIEQCVRDVVAIANGPRDHEQAKARIKELLDNVLSQRLSVAQKLRDQLRLVCNDVENLPAKVFLDELIEWLAAKHLRD